MIEIVKCEAPYARAETDWYSCLLGTCKFYRRGTPAQVEKYVVDMVGQIQKRRSIKSRNWKSKDTLPIRMRAELAEGKDDG